MSIVKAYYNGTAFVPIEPIDMPKGKVVKLSVLEDSANAEIAEKLLAFRQLTEEIRELNQEEPFSSELDDMLADQVNFTRELDL